MTRLVRVPAWAGAIALAVFLFMSPARAACNFTDIGDALKQSVETTLVCQTACKDEASCAFAIWLVAALTGIAAEGGQNLVDNFCAEVPGTIDQIGSKANTVFGSDLAQKYLGDFSSELAAIGAAAAVVKCACGTEKTNVASENSFGACFKDALCAADEFIFGNQCECTPEAPRVAACPAYDPRNCQSVDYIQKLGDPTCYPAGSIANCNTEWKNSNSYPDYAPSVQKVETPEGTLALVMPAKVDQCGAVQSCFCPKPMIPVWHEIGNPGLPGRRYIFSCDCPEGTHPGPLTMTGISACLCDNSNEPAIFSGLALHGMCPPPACPEGQVRMTDTGPCITPCSDPSKGMAFDGSCCDPAQMTSCGSCCPADTVPDPKSGSCVPRPKPPK
mgnify:CR=1 FL=1